MTYLIYQSRVQAYKGLAGLFDPLVPEYWLLSTWVTYNGLGGLFDPSVPGYWHIITWVAVITHESRVLTHKGLGGLFNLSVPGTGT